MPAGTGAARTLPYLLVASGRDTTAVQAQHPDYASHHPSEQTNRFRLVIPFWNIMYQLGTQGNMLPTSHFYGNVCVKNFPPFRPW
jgi:hypothetical protein